MHDYVYLARLVTVNQIMVATAKLMLILCSFTLHIFAQACICLLCYVNICTSTYVCLAYL